MGMLFYKVAFPFESRLTEFYSKRFNLGVVLAALTLPCIPIIVAFSTGGFLSIGYPQLVCVIKNSNAEHYSFTLPSSLIIATGISLLVVIATIIIKVKFILKLAIHQFYLSSTVCYLTEQRQKQKTNRYGGNQASVCSVLLCHSRLNGYHCIHLQRNTQKRPC